jgi:diaminopimelate decarboxylase
MRLIEIAHEYGTPAYVYQLDALRSSCEALRASLPAGSSLYYSLKANPHPLIVRTLLEAGCSAEVSSPGELRTALEAGAAPEGILYTGPGKTEAEIELALEKAGVWLSVESPVELRRIEGVAARLDVEPSCLLRINPRLDARGVGLAMAGHPSQFGADEGWVCAQAEAFRTERARIRGLHLYVGSNIESVDGLLDAFGVALAAVSPVCAALGIVPEVVDLGGGFGHPYARQGSRPELNGLAMPLRARLDETLKVFGESRPHVAFESGRYLAGMCGTLLCSVQDAKLSRGQRFVVLDSGINHLGGMQGLRRLRGLTVELVGPETCRGDSRDLELDGLADVVGPLCTPLDNWLRRSALPDLQEGDVVSVYNVGAYALTASLVCFLSRELPVEVVLDGDEVVDAGRLVVEREQVPSPIAVPVMTTT